MHNTLGPRRYLKPLFDSFHSNPIPFFRPFSFAATLSSCQIIFLLSCSIFTGDKRNSFGTRVGSWIMTRYGQVRSNFVSIYDFTIFSSCLQSHRSNDKSRISMRQFLTQVEKSFLVNRYFVRNKNIIL